MLTTPGKRILSSTRGLCASLAFLELHKGFLFSTAFFRLKVVRADGTEGSFILKVSDRPIWLADPAKLIFSLRSSQQWGTVSSKVKLPISNKQFRSKGVTSLVEAVSCRRLPVGSRPRHS